MKSSPLTDKEDDDGDTETVSPDLDDSDNVDPSAVFRRTRDPSEQGEQGSEDVDAQDGTNELERWEDVGSSRLLGKTSDDYTDRSALRPIRERGRFDRLTDDPRLGECDFQEQDLLDTAKVLDDTPISKEECTPDDPSAGGQEETTNRRDDPDFGELPFDRLTGIRSSVIGNGDGGNICKDGQEDDEVDSDSLVLDEDVEHDEDLKMDTKGDTVDDVCLHSVENLSSDLDSRDDGRKTFVKEDDVCGSSSGVRSTLDGDTAIGLLEGRGIVDTISSHGGEMTTFLKERDDLVLVFRENFGESIGSFDKVTDVRAGHATTDELFGIVDVGVETELFASFLGDGDGVSGEHLQNSINMDPGQKMEGDPP